MSAVNQPPIVEVLGLGRVLEAIAVNGSKHCRSLLTSRDGAAASPGRGQQRLLGIVAVTVVDDLVKVVGALVLVEARRPVEQLQRKGVLAKFSITHKQFIDWDPAVSNDCVTNYWLGQAYCVGLGGTAASSSTQVTPTPTPTAPTSSSSSSSGIPSSTTSSAAEATPSPIQDGMVEGCKNFYLVKPGDGCWAIANDNGIELGDFYVWNPAVSNGGECAALWPDVYVCVGV